MILDQLRRSSLYTPLHPLFEKAFAYLHSFDPAIADGKYELAGEDLIAVVQTYETSAPADRIFESHERYIDIQYMVSGREMLYYSDTSLLSAKTEYDAQKDLAFYHDREPNQPVYLSAGEFCVFFPHDGHKPSCRWDSAMEVRKVVMKVRVAV